MSANDWNKPAYVQEWDRSGDRTNPVRPEQLDILLSILCGMKKPSTWILDLGYGSGKVEQMIFERIPQSCVVGVDNSEEMMKLSKERLAPFVGRFESISCDLTQVPSLTLTEHPFQFVIAIQSLHHLSREDMQAIYHWIYRTLEPGGLFLLLDRLLVETDALWEAIRNVWTRQDAIHGSSVVVHEGTSFAEHNQIVLDRGDHPVLLDEHLAWLRTAGFEAACLHLHGNRALIAGSKPTTAVHANKGIDKRALS